MKPQPKLSADEKRLVEQLMRERARLCDETRLVNDCKALARIRRDMQLLRANRATTADRHAKLAARYEAAKARYAERTQAA